MITGSHLTGTSTICRVSEEYSSTLTVDGVCDFPMKDTEYVRVVVVDPEVNGSTRTRLDSEVVNYRECERDMNNLNKISQY